MVISILKHLVSLTLGLLIGYYLFSSETSSSNNDTRSEQAMSDVAHQQSASASKPMNVVQIPETTPTASMAKLTQSNVALNENDKKIIEQQKAQILALESEIFRLQKHQSTDETTQSLQVMSMNDFETHIKSQFLNRFRGIAIEVSGRELDGIRKEFSRNQTKAEWNADYENRITDFIQRTDSDGLHFVDELTCNNRFCRLTVNSSSPEDWRKLYHQMTEQSWYQSMTLSEKTNDPNRRVYYITEPNLNNR